MSTVDYLPFSTGSGHDETAQSAYLSAAWRSAGYAGGILTHQQLNKPLRQTSMISSAVAQAISDTLGVDVLDDGDLAGLVTKVKSAFATKGGLPGISSFAGIDITGTTDSATALQAAITATDIYIPSGVTILISSTINVPVGRLVTGAGKTSAIKSTSGDFTHFSLAAGAAVTNVTFQAVNAGTTAYVAGVLIDSASGCVVDRVLFTGLSYNGVRIRGASSNNFVTRCTTASFQNTATNQDCADVAIYSVAGIAAPSNNWVQDNTFLSGAQHGVLVQDPYTIPAITPYSNKVSSNEIGNSKSYGAVVYTPGVQSSFTASQSGTVMIVSAFGTGSPISVGQFVSTAAGTFIGQVVSLGTGTGAAGTYNMSLPATFSSQTTYAGVAVDSNNEVFDNNIHGVLGSVNPDSGAGVYVVGLASCGTKVERNTITDCCKSTSSTSLTPGAVGVNSTPFGASPVKVIDNTISGMTRYHGVIVGGGVGLGNAKITDNTITSPSSNTTGTPLFNNGQSNITFARNKVNQLNLGNVRCMFVYANSANIANFTCEDNEIFGGGTSIELAQAGGSTISNISICRNKAQGASAAGNGGIVLGAGAVTSGRVQNNDVSVFTNPAFTCNAATGLKITGNSFKSTGTYSAVLSGACTGSNFDSTNDFQALNNTSTGMLSRVFNNVFDFMTPAQIADVTSNTASIDLTAIIQSALDQKVDMWFPAGTYKLTASINLNDNQVIRCASRATIFKGGFAGAIFQGKNPTTERRFSGAIHSGKLTHVTRATAGSVGIDFKSCTMFKVYGTLIQETETGVKNGGASSLGAFYNEYHAVDISGVVTGYDNGTLGNDNKVFGGRVNDSVTGTRDNDCSGNTYYSLSCETFTTRGHLNADTTATTNIKYIGSRLENTPTSGVGIDIRALAQICMYIYPQLVGLTTNISDASSTKDTNGFSDAGLVVKSGTPIKGHLRVQVVKDVASLAAGAFRQEQFAVTGYAAGDAVSVTMPSTWPSQLGNGSCIDGGAGLVYVPIWNPSVGAIDPASMTYTFDIWKH